MMRLVPGGAGSEVRDDELVAQAIRQDPAAREALVRRYGPVLFGTVARLLGRRDDAEDVVQATFEIALRNLTDLRDPQAFLSWMLRIAVRESHRQLTMRRLRRSLGLDREDGDARLDALASIEASPEMRADLYLLARVLAELPTNQRIAWTLRYVEGLSLSEVAVATGCSLATAKRRLKAAHERVAEHVMVEGAEHD
jgi:RNA polymerase sigma-70 factor, ECF subfamily